MDTTQPPHPPVDMLLLGFQKLTTIRKKLDAKEQITAKDSREIQQTYFSIRHSRYFLEKSLHFSDW
jgi:hypothetical protein